MVIAVFNFIIAPHHGYAQIPNLGTPTTTNFTKEDYGAGHQNWDALCHNGRVFFANSGGLLSYNGTSWHTHTTPNNTVLRSLASGQKDTIYVGGQGELGFFCAGENGKLIYNSLIDENSSEVGEVWDLCYTEGKLYAQTNFNELTEFHHGQVKRFGQTNFISKVVLVNNEIWFHEQDEGLFRIKNGQAELIESSDQTIGYDISDILFYNETYYILTKVNGIFTYNGTKLNPWNTNADSFLKTKQIQCAKMSDDGALLIGTYLGGIIKVNLEGRSQLVLDKQHGLQNNSVSSLSYSPDGNLWVGTHNGIDMVHLDNGTSTFYPDGELEGSIYDIKKWQDKIFFCSSNGLYYIDDKNYFDPVSERKYELVEGSQGQTWGLDIIEDNLFLAHSSGAYQVNKDMSLTQILAPSGAWKFITLKPGFMAIGTYGGVHIMRMQNGEWKQHSVVPGLNESSRIMVYDRDKNLWISHPYRKVYKVNFNNDFSNSNLKEYDKNNGLLTDKRNYVFDYNGSCIVTNEQGVFAYNKDSDRFVAAKKLENIYPKGIHLRRLIKDNENNNIWAISDHGTDVVYPDSLDAQGNPLFDRIGSKANKDDYIGGFENLFPLDKRSFLQCTDSGVKVVTTPKHPTSLDQPLLTSVTLKSQGDSTLYSGYGMPTKIELNKNQTALHFEFSSMVKNKFGNYFTTYLKGLDEGWSEWTKTTSKEYTNLPHGDYTFEVKMMSINNLESPPTSIEFTIATPWHKSLLAYLIYAFITITTLLSLLLIPRKKYKENTAILESEKRKTEAEIIKVKEETEAEVIKLKEESETKMKRVKREAEAELARINREILENEILFKNKELAMSTMNLLQKNETLSAIRVEVEKVEKKIKDPQAKTEVKKIISLLRTDDRLEDDWSNFSIHFDQAHHQFLKRIKTEFPQLTPKDQKLCAYLRMNLSTKEIAPLLKISVRGVEISRYRLRKKIGLLKEVNLNDFMMNY